MYEDLHNFHLTFRQDGAADVHCAHWGRGQVLKLGSYTGSVPKWGSLKTKSHTFCCNKKPMEVFQKFCNFLKIKKPEKLLPWYLFEGLKVE